MTKILTITDSLSERAGGLSHATVNLALSASHHWKDSQFFILSQKDKSEISPSPSECPDNFHIISVPCLRNKIFPWSFGLGNAVQKIDPDLIHLRGLWRQPSLTCLDWKIHNPDKILIVQTAGMLEPWARSRSKTLKSIYSQFIENRLISCADYIHATSEKEVHTLLKFGIKLDRIQLVEEGVYMPINPHSNCSKEKSPRKLLFLSRLHPVKGIELFLDAWSLLRPDGWICEIGGMGEPAYVNFLRNYVDRLSLDKSVFFLGSVSGTTKQQALSTADAFILPSFSESFGIAIAEALSWGLPVITTTATPWRAIAERGMGWYVEPNLESLSLALFEMTQSSGADLHSMGCAGRSYISTNYDWSVVSQKIVKLYQSVLRADK